MKQRRNKEQIGLAGTPKKAREAMFVENIPNAVRTAFKSTCYLRGKTMHDVLLKFMRTYAESGGSLPRM